MTSRLIALLLAGALLAACGATPAAAPTGAPATAPAEQPAATAGLTPVKLMLPYIPNVQFAHYYTAAARGYYQAEGLDVSFEEYTFETNVVQLVAQGRVQFGMASGDSVLLARAQGLPVVTVATNSQRFPVVFISKAERNITKPEDLARDGVRVGIPGRFGASWIGLQALLYPAKIGVEALDVQEIGFEQVKLLLEDRVDVVSGYGNNEPFLLRQQGVEVSTIAVSDYYPLASDGIIASEQLVREQPEVVRRFVRATLRGMADVIADPDAAFTLALEYIPELKAAELATQELQRTVLRETIGYWQSDLTAREGLGFTDASSWEATHRFLRESGMLQQDVDVTQAFTNALLR